MSDYPPGEWSALLVGHVWPGARAVTALDTARANRGTINANFAKLYEMLQTALTTTLSGQKGITAEAIQQAFRDGAEQAFQIAEKNGDYRDVLQIVHNSVVELRRKLTGIAAQGNKEIQDIRGSREPLEAKVAKIAAAIAKYQQQAIHAAADCADDIMTAGQKVLDAQGVGGSFRALAQSINPTPQSDQNAIENHVRDQLKNPATATGAVGRAGETPPDSSPGQEAGVGSAGDTSAEPIPTSGTAQSLLGNSPLASPDASSTIGNAGETSSVPGPGEPAAVASPQFLPASGNTPESPQALSRSASPGGAPPQILPASGNTPAGPPPGAGPAQPQFSSASGSAPAGLPAGGGGIPASPAMSPPPVPSTPSTPSIGAPGGMPASAMPGFAGNGIPPVQPGASAPTGPTGLSPGTVAPPSMGPVTSSTPQIPSSVPTYPSAAGTAAPAFDTPTPIQQVPSTASPAPAPYSGPGMGPPAASGPAPGMGPQLVASAPANSVGPLPTYGADLRPPIAAPASTTSAPPPTALASPPAPAGSMTPTHPTTGSSGTTQPTVVSRSGTAPAPSPAQAPPGVGAQAAIATAGGTLAGAVSATASAQIRLQRLVEAAARQQPQLRWAVADRADHTTVLVTDVAGGWIPPGVEVPAAVTLLEPARRRNDMEALLGEVNLVASHTPGHHLPEPTNNDEPVRFSPRPRRAPEIEELGWELSHATHWRDGLPMLAHTLARAASRGTGVLDSELDQLHKELTKVAARILEDYPDAIDSNHVGNWQLLAAIEALAGGDKNTANYHLAWFLACNTAVGVRQ